MPSTAFIVTLVVVIARVTLTNAIPVDNSGNAYSGMGGDASGGNIAEPLPKGIIASLIHGHGINLFSGDGGNGGYAASGDAIGGVGGKGSNSGNAYSGNGGNANGGSVDSGGALINLFSNYAGSGGDASSGSAIGDGGDVGGDTSRKEYHESDDYHDGNEDNGTGHHHHGDGDYDEDDNCDKCSK